MPILQSLDLRYKLQKLEIKKASDRWFGVEPYVIPMFFKVDGDRFSAFLRLLNTQPPDEGTTQVVETRAVQLQLTADPEHEPTISMPSGPILRSDIHDLDAGDEMSASDLDVKFDTTLKPIPLVIEVLGLFNLNDILEKLRDPVAKLILEASGEVELINLAVESVSDYVAKFMGLDEELETCPGLDVDVDEMINQIEADFESLIPGTIGGVFVMMENDDFDEDDVAAVQGVLVGFLKDTLNDATDSVALVNPIPEVDIDPAAAADALIWDIAGALLFRFDPWAWCILTKGWLWGAPDDMVGFVERHFTHMDIGEDDKTFSETPEEADGNKWKLTAKLSLR